jgi:hypothetical protein
MQEKRPITTGPLWLTYVQNVLKEHPDYKVKQRNGYTENYYILDKNGKEVTNFGRFNLALERFFYNAGDLMLETGGMMCLPGVGRMYMARIETHPMSRQVNFHETMKQEPRPNGTRPAVYKENTEWVKICFLADEKLSNYEFVASKPCCKKNETSLVGRLCNMMKASPLLRLKYEYQPLDRPKEIGRRRLVKNS